MAGRHFVTFALDRTRSYLKIEEPHLLSLHRSIHPVVPAADYCQGHPCDAFICVVHEYNLHRVYLALHDQQAKSNLVFTTDPIKPDPKNLAELIRKAHGFLENIGFEMKPVDIDFSTATREVIIKDTRVLREPSLALQLEAARMALEVLSAEKEEVVLKASEEQRVLTAEVVALRKHLGAAAAGQQTSVAGLPAAPENRDSAEVELQKVREELGTVTSILKNTVENLKQAKEEVRQSRKEQKQHKLEMAAVHEQLKFAQAGLDTARSEYEGIRHEFREATKKFESALHKRANQNTGAEKAHQAELAGLKAEIVRLSADLASNEAAHSGEVEFLRTALAEATASLAVEKEKNESALREMDALEHNASDELKLLKKKVDTLISEKQLLEKIATEIKKKARGEIERQQQINEAQRAAAIKKLQALQEEIRLLAEARAVIASPIGTAIAPVPSTSQVPSHPADGGDASVFSQQVSFASDPFASIEAADYISFLPDKSLNGIPYASPADVVEVYRSYNTIHAAPTGKRAQRCDGFACLVTEGEQSRVYVAWRMNSSGEVLVCLPEHVSGGDESCRRALRDGIGYFERIGFVIDRLTLDADPDKRLIQLDGLSVFCRTAPDCVEPNACDHPA